jgi:hypothetical protein
MTTQNLTVWYGSVYPFYEANSFTIFNQTDVPIYNVVLEVTTNTGSYTIYLANSYSNEGYEITGMRNQTYLTVPHDLTGVTNVTASGTTEP